MNSQASAHDKVAGQFAVERRKKPRQPAQGEVRLFLDEPSLSEVRGRLIDTGDGTFRAAHDFHGLRAGQMVRFRTSSREGTARVIWNRVLDQVVESGFLILET